LAFPGNKETEAISLPQQQSGISNGTLARCDADGRCDGKQSDDKAVAPSVQRRQSKRMRSRRSHGKKRGKSASGSARKRRSLIRVYAVSVRHSDSRPIKPFAKNRRMQVVLRYSTTP
jgi:hypothetical protein